MCRWRRPNTLSRIFSAEYITYLPAIFWLNFFSLVAWTVSASIGSSVFQVCTASGFCFMFYHITHRSQLKNWTQPHCDVLCTVYPLSSLGDWAVKLPHTLLIQHDIAVVSKWYSQRTALDNRAALHPCGHVLNCMQVWCFQEAFSTIYFIAFIS